MLKFKRRKKQFKILLNKINNSKSNYNNNGNNIIIITNNKFSNKFNKNIKIMKHKSNN